MSRAGSDSQSQEIQQREEEYAQPRVNRRPRRRNNTQNKIFKCLCGSKYSSVAAWYTHFKKHDKDSEERRKQIKQAFDNLLDELFERADGPQVNIEDIPTFHEEASHKESSDKAFASICTLWRTKPAQTYGNVDDNIFDRRRYQVDGDIFSFEGLITRRREVLARDVQHLLQQYSLQDLYRRAGSNNEFRDYKLRNGRFEGRFTLNFTWDLVKYFKPAFAAKLQVFLYAMCCKDQLNLNNWQEWKDFKAAQWGRYSFIESILEQYHKEWIGRNPDYIQYQ